MTDGSDARLRLTVLNIVRGEMRHIEQEIVQQLEGIEPSKSHVSGLLNSLTWHASRKTIALQLAEFRKQLTDLREKANGREQALYTYLLERLEPNRDQDEVRSALNNIDMTRDELESWRERADHMLALTIMRIVQSTLRSRELEADLTGITTDEHANHVPAGSG